MIPGIKNIQALIITVIIFVSGIAQAQTWPYISVNIPLHNCYMDGIKAYGTTGTSLVLAGSSTDVNGITLVQISNSATSTVRTATGTQSWSSTERILSTLDDGLVFYANLNEPNGTNVIKDTSRFGITGTNTGSVGTTTSKYGRARYFDGTDDVVTFANNTQLNPGTSSFSITLWTKPTEIKECSLLSRGSGLAYGLEPQQNTDLYSYIVLSGTGQKSITSTNLFGTGTWKNIAMVVDRTDLANNVFKIFSNGVQIGTNTFNSSGSISTSVVMTLGSRQSALYYKGYLDDIRMYNRALSNAEVLQLYQLTTPDILNTFSATAQDGAGNQGTDTIHVGRFPTVSTTDATAIARNSAMLNGTCSANLNTSTVWFEYGLSSGNYVGSSTTAQVLGDTDTAVNISLGALNKDTEYFFRLRGSNAVGETYGEEYSFTTLPGYTLEEVTGINKPLSWSLLETTKFLHGLRNYGIYNWKTIWRSTQDRMDLIDDPDTEITEALEDL